MAVVAEAPAAPQDEALPACAWAALRGIVDPELGVNVVDLGLIEAIEAREPGLCVRMTLTSAACPMAELLLDDVEQALQALLTPPLAPALTLVFTPAWTPARMSPAARAQLGWAAGA